MERWSKARLSVLVLAALLGWLAAVAFARAEPAGPVALLDKQNADGEFPGWQSFHESPGAKTGAVWSLGEDGVLHCKGEPLGYLFTEQKFTNFVLRLEWRWPEGCEPGRGGVLLRMTGPNRIWPKSLEAQINVGNAGDFWGLDGYALEGPADRMKTVEHPQFGRLTNVAKLAEVERPAGEWNQYEIRAEGPTVTLTINGREVNRATDCDVVAGRIVLTAEGNPIEFRNLHLQPLE